MFLLQCTLKSNISLITNAPIDQYVHKTTRCKIWIVMEDVDKFLAMLYLTLVKIPTVLR